MRRRRAVSEHEQRAWLASNVRARRREMGLSMREASERVGMHLRHWQKIEGGETNATMETLAKLSTALGVDVVDLISEPRRAARG